MRSSVAPANKAALPPREWPTMAIAIGCWGGFAAMLVWHDRLPWPLVLLGFALMGIGTSAIFPLGRAM